MKPNPEQDADRAAFEAHFCSKPGGWPDERLRGGYKNPTTEALWWGWRAAKADSRAMEDSNNA